MAGSVAVNRHGARVGKGGGYGDLEFALARELGAIDTRTVVVNTVHDLQVVPTGVLHCRGPSRGRVGSNGAR